MNCENVTDIEFNTEAFDKLVLPNGEKELAWSFVESKNSEDIKFDDFVPEKGGRSDYPRMALTCKYSNIIATRPWPHHTDVWATRSRQDLHCRS